MKYCKYCGEKLRDESRFCYHCGMPCGDGPVQMNPADPEVTAEDFDASGKTDAEDMEVPAGENYAEPDFIEPDFIDSGDGDAGGDPGTENDEAYADDSEPDGSNGFGSDDSEPDGDEGFGSDDSDLDSGGFGSDDSEPDGSDDSDDEGDFPGGISDFADDEDEDELPFFDEPDYGEMRTRKRKRRRNAGIAAAVILAALAGYLLWSPGRRAFTDAASGRTDAAKQTFNEQAKGKPTEEALLMLTAPFGIDYAFSQYNRGEIYYEDAEERIRTLGEIGKAGGAAERRLNQLSTLYDSKVAFLAGDKARENGDPKTALLNYGKVVREDRNYSTASELAEQMKEQYITDVTGKLDGLSSAEEFRSAIAELEEAQEVLPGDQTVKDALTRVRQSYAADLKANAVPQATSYMDDGYYKEAIDILNDALLYNAQDTELITLRNQALQKYEDFVSSQYKIYIDNKDMEGAAALLDKAAKDMPDSLEVARLYEDLRTK